MAKLGIARLGSVTLAATAALALPAAASAQTFEVDRFDDPAGPGACTPAPSDCSLEQAAVASHAGDPSDLITLGPGDYTAKFVDLEGSARVVGAGVGRTIVHSPEGFVASETEPGEPTATYELTDMTLTGAKNEGPKYGGALMVRAPTTVRRVAFIDNEDGAAKYGTQLYPAWGGAIFVNEGELTLEDSLVAGNIANAGPDGTNATGAGIYFAGTNGRIRNTTIAENVATGGATPATGAGVAVGGKGVVRLENDTFAANVASGGAGSGGADIAVDPGATVTSRGSIFALGQPPSSQNCLGRVLTLGGNIDDGTTCGMGATDRIATSPLLGPLVDNGGPTKTMALLAGSPAIDLAGTCGIATDQRGLPRPAAACDAGAYEVPLPPPPNCSVQASGNVAKLLAVVTCDVPASLTINGQATIRGKTKKKAGVSAAKTRTKKPKSVKLPATTGAASASGVPVRLKLTLPSRVRTAVLAGKRVSLDLALTASTSGGVASTATAHLKKVGRPPRKKRH